MPYEESLAERVREALIDREDLTERKMFGGLCFMLGGNMLCGVMGSELMVRVGPDGYGDALAQSDAREMDFTGRSMRGMVYVAAAGIAEEAALAGWLGRGIAFAGALPPKA